MKKRIQNSCSAMMMVTLCIAVPVIAQTENSAQNAVKGQQAQSNQMSAQSNNANASRGAQGNKLQQQQQERLKESHGEGQAVGGANRHKGQYKGQPSIEGKFGPAGSKNKPQKSGSRGK